MAEYRLAPSWRLERLADGWELYGGDDARFLVPAAGFIERLAAGEELSRSQLDRAEVTDFEKFLSAAVIQPVVPFQTEATIAFIGDEVPLACAFPGSARNAPPDQADLLVVVRHTSSQAETVRRALTLERPHLYIDLAFHHTLSIGPLVIPHETPCIACLHGRLRERWGERVPVERPEAWQEYPGVISALVFCEIERIIRGDTSLVGWTFAWNLAERDILKEKLLTAPLCDYCRHTPRVGMIPL